MLQRWTWKLAVVGMIAALLASCSTPPGRGVFERSRLSVEETQQADAALDQLRGLVEAARWPEASRLGLETLDRYPGYEKEAELLWLTAGASERAGRGAVAERLWEAVLRDHPRSVYATEAMWHRANSLRERGDREAEARLLIALHDRLPENAPRRDAARRRLRMLFDEEMSLEELDHLAADHATSFVGSSVAWAAIERAEAAERPTEEIGRRLEAFLENYPQSRHRDQASARLARLAKAGEFQPTGSLPIARVDRIGVLAPLSGEYAALGQALYDGALLALEEHNRAALDSLSMVGLDTRGDEVVAVLAARELIEKDQAIAIVGALTSATTTAVAVLCQERGVPLVSPTATNENISTLGNFVFQTNLTRDFETTVVARAAVQGLLRKRFAILYPDDEDGRSKADLFSREVESLGGRIVAREALQRGQTDFGASIRRVRAAGPEALFLPLPPSEMRLLGPQLVFHDLRVQLLGPSTWNNGSLLRQARDSLDRALVPSDQALVSQDDAEHFARQWRRRFPARAASPFAQKAYFAMRRVIDSLDPAGEDTRDRLRSKIEMAFLDPGATGESPFAKLRLIDDGKVVPFPALDLPGLVVPPVAEADSLDLELDIEDLGEFGAGERGD